eukprot:6475226-Amphidinium_carterae.2
MLDYYKAHRNATAAAAEGIVTHAESPLRDLLGDDFPYPCPHVCGTGDLEGFWAPPACLDDPGRCIEVVNPAPSWDIAYGEQLINNLGLEAVVGYYGISGMFSVISSLAGTGRSMPFIWFEPDEFTLKQGAEPPVQSLMDSKSPETQRSRGFLGPRVCSKWWSANLANIF